MGDIKQDEIEVGEVINNFTVVESNAGEKGDTEEEEGVAKRAQPLEIEDGSKSKRSKASSNSDESGEDEGTSQDIIQKTPIRLTIWNLIIILN